MREKENSLTVSTARETPDSLSVLSSSAASLSEEALRPLRRLHQLSGEIEAALARHDLVVVAQAASLLAPALTACHTACDAATLRSEEARQFVAETRRTLDACEAALTQAMNEIASDLRRIQKGRQVVTRVRRSQTAVITSCKLDTHR